MDASDEIRDEESDRRGLARGNLFVWALRGEGPPERAGLARFAAASGMVLVRVVLVFVVFATIVAPVALAAGLVYDGLAHGRSGSALFGLAVAALIVMMARAALRRARALRRAAGTPGRQR